MIEKLGMEQRYQDGLSMSGRDRVFLLAEFLGKQVSWLKTKFFRQFH